MSSLPHPFLCSKIHFQIPSLSFLSKSFPQLHSDFLWLFNISLVYYSISVSSIVCLVSKRGSNQQNSVMSKLSATSPWSKVKTAKKKFQNNWPLSSRLSTRRPTGPQSTGVSPPPDSPEAPGNIVRGPWWDHQARDRIALLPPRTLFKISETSD